MKLGAPQPWIEYLCRGSWFDDSVIKGTVANQDLNLAGYPIPLQCVAKEKIFLIAVSDARPGQNNCSFPGKFESEQDKQREKIIHYFSSSKRQASPVNRLAQ